MLSIVLDEKLTLSAEKDNVCETDAREPIATNNNIANTNWLTLVIIFSLFHHFIQFYASCEIITNIIIFHEFCNLKS